ncbi:MULTISPECIES: S8 family serine peptidase [unclassified Kitasatospora]|uniref:S8 family serine peptidase n=1 Tax=unclassified Kitasatospora TaxID=2633591 RepID=UPI003400CF54
MTPLEMVRLPSLMTLTEGSRQVVVALLDGPVPQGHPELATESVRRLPGLMRRPEPPGAVGAASRHGTFTAGILAARRGREAPAICPNCTLLVRPIFTDTTGEDRSRLGTTVDELASALLECINAGARIINLSVGSTYPSTIQQPRLHAALDHAAEHGVLVVAAAGNQGTLGTSALTRHPWVLPVAAFNLDGRPSAYTNLGRALGRRGIGGPGEKITSLGAEGDPPPVSGGTSAAAAFVTGAAALLWSLFPSADVAEIKNAVLHGRGAHRGSVVPPLLDAWRAYSLLTEAKSRRAS